MSVITPPGYYDSYVPSVKDWKRILFKAGFPLQSAEMNALQSMSDQQFEKLCLSLYKEGAFVDGGDINLTQATDVAGDKSLVVTVSRGTLYALGYFHSVPQSEPIVITGKGTEVIGISINNQIVTYQQDADLLDPATGSENEGQEGADRLQFSYLYCLGNAIQTAPYSLTRGIAPDSTDLLPVAYTPALSLVSVSNNSTVWLSGVDYKLNTANTGVDWSLPGSEPVASAVYTVVSTYTAKNVTPIATFVDGQLVKTNSQSALLQTILAIIAEYFFEKSGSYLVDLPVILPNDPTDNAAYPAATIQLEIDGGIGYPSGIRYSNKGKKLFLIMDRTLDGAIRSIEPQPYISPNNLFTVDDPTVLSVSAATATVMSGTQTITKGSSGGTDLIPVQFQPPDALAPAVVQYNNGTSTVTFVQGSDFNISGNYIDWSPVGPNTEPPPGAQYTYNVGYAGALVKAIRTLTSVVGETTTLATSTSTFTISHPEISAISSISASAGGMVEGVDFVMNYATGKGTYLTGHRPADGTTITVSYTYWARTTGGEYLVRDSFVDAGGNVLLYSTPNYVPAGQVASTSFPQNIVINAGAQTVTIPCPPHLFVGTMTLKINGVQHGTDNNNGGFTMDGGAAGAVSASSITGTINYQTGQVVLTINNCTAGATITFLVSGTCSENIDYTSQFTTGVAGGSPRALVSNRNVSITYEYALARYDVLFWQADGQLILEKGIPDVSPVAPKIDATDLPIAKFFLKPEAFASDVKQNIEYYGNQTLLETDLRNILNTVRTLQLNQSTLALQNSTFQIPTATPLEGSFSDDLATPDLADVGNTRFVGSFDFLSRTIQLPRLHENPTIGLAAVDASAVLKDDIWYTSFEEALEVSQPFSSEFTQINNLEAIDTNAQITLSPAADTPIYDNIVGVITSTAGKTPLTPDQLVQQKLLQNVTGASWTAQSTGSGGSTTQTNPAFNVPPDPMWSATLATNSSEQQIGLINQSQWSTIVANSQVVVAPTARQTVITISGSNFVAGERRIQATFNQIPVDITPTGGTVADDLEGSVKADTNGQWTGTITVPADTPTGVYPIEILGYASNDLTLVASYCASNFGAGGFIEDMTIYVSEACPPIKKGQGVLKPIYAFAGALGMKPLKAMLATRTMSNLIAAGIVQAATTSVTVTPELFAIALDAMLSTFVKLVVSSAVKTKINNAITLGNKGGSFLGTTATKPIVKALTLVTDANPAGKQVKYAQLTQGFASFVNQTIDPLAETFTLDEDTYLSSVDLFFQHGSDLSLPVQVAISSTEVGIPTEDYLDVCQIDASAININPTVNGGLTKFTFDKPIFLTGGTEYSFIVLTEDPSVTLYIARLGATDIATNSLITKQPAAGVMLRSPNRNTWEPDSTADIKFNLNTTRFIDSDGDTITGVLKMTSVGDASYINFGTPRCIFSLVHPVGEPDTSTLVQWQYCLDVAPNFSLNSTNKWVTFYPYKEVNLGAAFSRVAVRIIMNGAGDGTIAPTVLDNADFTGYTWDITNAINTTTLASSNDVLAINSGAQNFTHNIPNAPLEPGSVVINIAGVQKFTDNGLGTLTFTGTLSTYHAASITGTVNYTTGAVVLTFNNVTTGSTIAVSGTATPFLRGYVNRQADFTAGSIGYVDAYFDAALQSGIGVAIYADFNDGTGLHALSKQSDSIVLDETFTQYHWQLDTHTTPRDNIRILIVMLSTDPSITPIVRRIRFLASNV